MCRAISLAKDDEHHKTCDTAGIAKDLLASALRIDLRNQERKEVDN